MTFEAAVDWMARLAAVAAAIAALELLWVRDALSDRGVFAWPVLRRELAGAPRAIRALADAVLGYRGMCGALALQLAAALALPFTEHPAPPWIAFAAALVTAIRFRGTYNGGSDAMLLIVTLAVALARTAPGSDVARGGLAYAAAQLVLSYFVAGIAKLRDPAWRSGRALPIVVALPQYQVSGRLRAALSRAVPARLAAWSMLGFECGFPLALAGGTACRALLAAGACFHLANAVGLGLNRFLWTWIAAYPALLYWVAARGR